MSFCPTVALITDGSVSKFPQRLRTQPSTDTCPGLMWGGGGGGGGGGVNEIEFPRRS